MLLAGNYLLGSYLVGRNRKTDSRNVYIKSGGGLAIAPKGIFQFY